MIKHMNAVALKGNKYNEIINNPNYIIEEKLKGIRAFVVFRMSGNIILSRGGHDISHRFPHIRDHIFPNLEGVILDGELYQPGVEDEVIAGWGNHRTKYIDSIVTRDVKLYAFDCIDTNLPSEFLIQRKRALEEVLMDPDLETIVQHVPWYLCGDSLAEIKYEYYLSQGGEGIMLKNKYAIYEPGKRLNNNWYKLKGSETFDVIITGFNPPEQYSTKVNGEVSETKFWKNGWIGSFSYGMYNKNVYKYKMPFTSDSNINPNALELQTLGTCSGMDEITRVSMTFNPERWLMQVVELEGVEQKTSGAIDHPRYKRLRPDKMEEECIWTP